jgi:2-C-methyl-D-erythritol 4-phosphate cytidylyltransferase
MVSVIIVSGGVGKRAKLSYPKQFYNLCGKTILEICVSKFDNSSLVDNIIIVSNSDFIEETKKTTDYFKKVKAIVDGGKTRSESVYNGLVYLKEFSPNLVLVHDAVRPFISTNKIEEIIKCSKIFKNVVPIVDEKNTVSITDNEKIIEMPERTTIKIHQTPQCCDYNQLLKSYEKIKDKFDFFTDEASILLNSNISPFFIVGEESNIKITTDIDLMVAKLIYEEGEDVE